ncbi:MAG: hypothetical protein GY820_02175, partial [Gammaproteobacteria bacterium]|nr:hypothetical protein [Gammaproteobacteria bacterium]
LKRLARLEKNRQIALGIYRKRKRKEGEQRQMAAGQPDDGSSSPGDSSDENGDPEGGRRSESRDPEKQEGEEEEEREEDSGDQEEGQGVPQGELGIVPKAPVVEDKMDTETTTESTLVGTTDTELGESPAESVRIPGILEGQEQEPMEEEEVCEEERDDYQDHLMLLEESLKIDEENAFRAAVRAQAIAEGKPLESGTEEELAMRFYQDQHRNKLTKEAMKTQRKFSALGRGRPVQLLSPSQFQPGARAMVGQQAPFQ